MIGGYVKAISTTMTALCLVLATGCTSGEVQGDASSGGLNYSSTVPSTSAPTAAPEPPTPSPSASPTTTEPTELTIEEAGALYLSAVCPANDAGDKYSKMYDRFELYASNSDTPNPKTQKAAQAAADAKVRQAQILSDPEAGWPSSLRKDLDAIATQNYEFAAWYSSIADAKTWSDVESVPGSGKGSKAASSVRLKLGLPPRGEGCPNDS